MPLCIYVLASSLSGAARSGDLEIAQLPLDHSADPNLRGSATTPLMKAADSGHLAMVELLIKRGADLDAVHPEYGSTAFHVACDGIWPGCAEALV